MNSQFRKNWKHPDNRRKVGRPVGDASVKEPDERVDIVKNSSVLKKAVFERIKEFGYDYNKLAARTSIDVNVIHGWIHNWDNSRYMSQEKILRLCIEVGIILRLTIVKAHNWNKDNSLVK